MRTGGTPVLWTQGESPGQPGVPHGATVSFSVKKKGEKKQGKYGRMDDRWLIDGYPLVIYIAIENHHV